MRQLEGKVEWVLVGNETFGNPPTRFISFSLEGIVGNKHAGFDKLADFKDGRIPHGRLVRNTSQWTAISLEEVAETSRKLGLTQPIWRSLYTENLCISGVPKFSQLPKGSQLWFPESEAILQVEEQNEPCSRTGEKIARLHPSVNPKTFKDFAAGLRGLYGVVQSPGIVRDGAQVIVDVYEPKTYFQLS